jgi:choline dehydrogenase
MLCSRLPAIPGPQHLSALLEVEVASAPGNGDPACVAVLIGSSVDCGFRTTPLAGSNGRSLPNPRGKVLDGSSSINAMMYLGPPRSSYDAWAP